MLKGHTIIYLCQRLGAYIPECIAFIVIIIIIIHLTATINLQISMEIGAIVLYHIFVASFPFCEIRAALPRGACCQNTELFTVTPPKKMKRAIINIIIIIIIIIINIIIIIIVVVVVVVVIIIIITWKETKKRGLD